MKIRNSLFTLSSFLLPLIILLENASFHNLGFADASEFALVTKIFGIAHPPGFPSYIVFASAFSRIIEVTGISHVAALVIFSAICVSLACIMLYMTSILILNKIYFEKNELSKQIISLIVGISPATGATIWHWGHSVEVYAFQLFAMGLLIYGITCFEINKKNKCLIIAAIGFGLGLANHHLTMILFSPFLLLLLSPGWLNLPVKENKKKNIPVKQSFWSFINTKPFYIFTCTTIGILFLFYGWMYIRASSPLVFMFGNPDSVSRWFYHLSGGAWIENTKSEVKGIISMRFPYFMHLKFTQFLFFIPFLVTGIIALLKQKLYRVLFVLGGFYLVVLIYQLRIDQTSDTDAYMCAPYYLLALLLPAGLMMVLQWNQKLVYLFPCFLILNYVINYPETNLKKFDLSDSLMREIDEASPKGAVILIADWTNVITYTYYRNAYNFRPDLFVLNYDLKFTNYKILERQYPLLYKAIKPEYDRFVKLLGDAHPQEIYNTGCTMDTREIMDSYLAVIKKLQAFCSEHNTAFMGDPKTFVTLYQYGVFNTSHISGCLVSDRPTGMGHNFLNLNFHWLDEQHLLEEPAAGDKLVDLEAALDFNRNYFKQTGDTLLFAKAENSYQRIKQKQRDLKHHMPFLFRPQ